MVLKFKKSKFGYSGGVGAYGNNLMGLPPVYPNMKTFPQLGAFNGEVGPGTSPGGISNNGMFPRNMPLNYWWNFGSSKKNCKCKKCNKCTCKNKTKASSKMCKCSKRRFSTKSTKKRKSTKTKKRFSTKKRRFSTKKSKKPRKSKRKSRKSRKSRKRKSKKKSICKERLSNQIRKNIRLFKEKKEFTSNKQAIAVAYSQISKKYPRCRF